MDTSKYEAVIGLEVHAELMTNSKMFCGCPVVDSVEAEPNTAVCPVCLGMPGMLPVINRRAVEFAIKVGLALNCTIEHHNIFARKNYFYPDLPKGYQVSQYELPLCRHGQVEIELEDGSTKVIRVRRVHMEEDTGKLTHRPEGCWLACRLQPLWRAAAGDRLRAGHKLRARSACLRHEVASVVALSGG